MTENYIDTADLIATAAYDDILHVLLVERDWPPFAGHLALPGGHVDPGESVSAAAVRECTEETGVIVNADKLIPVGVYDEPGRDPRGPYRTTAYRVSLDSMHPPVAGDDARTARWIPVPALGTLQLAFDHRDILRDAIAVITDL